jgi:hypothetical protein
MAEVRIRERIWENIKAAAAQQGERPEALANRALEEYLGRLADEELIARSSKAAKRTAFRATETEKVIGQYRRRK